MLPAMKTVTKYISALGGTFSSAAEAIADEDRLPRLIATYTADIQRIVPGGPVRYQMATRVPRTLDKLADALSRA